MATYEPINERKENHGGDETVIQISQSSTPTLVKLNPHVVANKNEEQCPLILPPNSKQHHQQRLRLVSLDVFRGITVAVMFSSSPFSLFFFLFFFCYSTLQHSYYIIIFASFFFFLFYLIKYISSKYDNLLFPCFD